MKPKSVFVQPSQGNMPTFTIRDVANAILRALKSAGVCDKCLAHKLCAPKPQRALAPNFSTERPLSSRPSYKWVPGTRHHASCSFDFKPEVALRLARRKAQALRLEGVTPDDLEDFAQEIFLDAWKRFRRGYDPQRSSPGTFLNLIMHRQASSISKHWNAQRARYGSVASLSEPTGGNGHETSTLQDMLDSDDLRIRQGTQSRPAQELRDLSIDVARALKRMPPRTRSCCLLLMEGYSIAEVSRTMGIRRSTLHDMLRKLRLVFRDYSVG